MQTVKKYISRFLVRLGKRFGAEEVQEVALCQPEPQKEDKEEKKKVVQLIKRETEKKKSTEITEYDPRDMMELMEVPFLSLSKNRTKPIDYRSKDGKIKVKITANREHYLASIYDWDIILFVAAKIQEILNTGSDIPPRTILVARSKLIKSINKHNVGTTGKEIEAALNRLSSTLIDTTIRNEDCRYRAGFGFLDSWAYTERKDIKEFMITLSDWLYDGICRKGSLLKVSQEYFDLTSGLKKFLYRTARKHVGGGEYWEFSVEKLYEKSGSERAFKKFKHDLKKAVMDNNIPDYTLEWREEKGKELIRFINKNIDQRTIEINSTKRQVQKTVTTLKFPKNSKNLKQ